MARLTRLRTMLDVRSILETVAFYELLGFAPAGIFGDPEQPVWCQVVRDDVALMFTWSPPHEHEDGDPHSHEPAMAGSIYIDVDDVDELFSSLSNAGVAFEWEPESFEHGMREFAVRDPNGYMLVFGMPVG